MNENLCPTHLGPPATEADLKEFTEAAFSFLDGFKTRDRSLFLRHLKEGTEFTAILPTPKGAILITDLKEYIAFQDFWFASQTGSFNYQPLRMYVEKGMANIVVRAEYCNTDEAGKFKKDLVILFTFRKIDGQWFKVYSQNTLVAEVR